MPLVFTEADIPVLDDAASPRKKWTREELEYFERQGMLGDARYELIEGDLIEKMGKNPPHLYVLRTFSLALGSFFGAPRVLTEATIALPDPDSKRNAPEPDIVVLKQDFRSMLDRLPGPGDIDLIVEVADTTAAFDLRVKRDLYSRAGIPEYWVLDIGARLLYVHRAIQKGKYTFSLEYNERESVAPLAAPARNFAIKDAFPEPAAE